MSGTENPTEQSELEEELALVLDRHIECHALKALILALRPDDISDPLQSAALGIDANVFLRITKHPKSADIIDYLSGRHSGPLILPGQAVQEFWNNQLQAVDTISMSVQRKFDTFKADLIRVPGSHGEQVRALAHQVDLVLREYSAEHGHIYDEGTTRATVQFLELLDQRASVPFARRSRFQSIANHRKRTKTPPGFKDDGDGDFFVWADFLTGLQQEKRRHSEFSHVVFVSNDQKPDWSRAGIAHPILVAEVKALVGVPFYIWDLDRLAREVSLAA